MTVPQKLFVLKNMDISKWIAGARKDSYRPIMEVEMCIDENRDMSLP